MHIHILGICGTFMGGVAVLAQQLGHRVTGSDAHVYPPISTQLAEQGITIWQGYDIAHLQPAPDLVIVGNAMKRGNPAIEYLLAQGIPYLSGPQWLAEQVLKDRWVLAVAGTHGKTTTSSLLAWILEYAGMQPGFLIGGIPENFGVSARLGGSSFFVVEADEYDSAFFDKRSKFVHYKPRTLILNNLEFDHADIFPDLAAIQQQFHHLLRTVPDNGLLICPKNDDKLQAVLQQGCWTPVTYTEDANSWHMRNASADGHNFDVYYGPQYEGSVQWELLGQHNIHNAFTALVAARHVGVPPHLAIAAMAEFKSIKRRMEIKGIVNGITVYDDFAHHPTAIATTLAGLRGKVGSQTKIHAVLELASYTMRTGVHKQSLISALSEADQVYFAQPKGDDWGLAEIASSLKVPAQVYAATEAIITALIQDSRPGETIIIMSNSGFDGIHGKLLAAMESE